MVESRAGTLSFAEAEQRLRGPAAGLPPLVLAAGEEAWLRNRLTGAFRAGGEVEGAEVRRLEGDELSAADLERALQVLPLFGGGLRLWIREGSKLAKPALESLLGWADGPGEGVRVLLTTAREVAELKALGSLASRAAVVTCALRPPERTGWVKRMAEESGLALPAGLLAAIAASAPNLLAASREVEKLAALADASGRVLPAAAQALRGAAGEGSVERWVDALLTRDRIAGRAESAALSGAGVGGTSALWALAERALGSLEPGGVGWPRRPAAPALPPGLARRVLDAVYRADRALKRGELKDADLIQVLTAEVEDAMTDAGGEGSRG
ncbi:MAG TPA: hypothetical protein VID50_03485 [Candidatus Eisenbacteria bacterium]|jgi:DNA polymerase III delta subunit